LRENDLIFIYDDVILSYVPPSQLNWSLVRLVESKFEICDALIDSHNIPMEKSFILSEILKWAVFARAGITRIDGLSADLNILFNYAVRNGHPINLFFAFLLVIPQFLSREIVVIALAISAGKRSSLGFFRRLKDARGIVN
jgi:hypothetical protein